MDTMPSSEFRKRYASLTNPTVVTVNGHTIGTWTPGPNYIVTLPAEATREDIDRARERLGMSDHRSFNSRPFTPVPKHR